MLDVVVIERCDALTMDSEARHLTLALRNVERLTHDRQDDLSRTIYGEVRAAMMAARQVTGILSEVLPS